MSKRAELKRGDRVISTWNMFGKRVEGTIINLYHNIIMLRFTGENKDFNIRYFTGDQELGFAFRDIGWEKLAEQLELFK